MSKDGRSRRAAIASGAAVIATVAMACFGWAGMPVAAVLALTVFVASAFLVHAPHHGAQLFVRGLWGAGVLLATMTWLYGPSSSALPALATATSLVGGLIALGRDGLGAREAAGAFAPNAFRAPLLLALAVAVADALSISFYGVLWAELLGRYTVLLPLGLALGVSAIGLYRMRVWGLLAAALAAATVGTLATIGHLPVPGTLLPVYMLSSAVQLLALSPMLFLAARKLFTAEQSVVDRTRIAATSSAAVAMPDADRTIEDVIGNDDVEQDEAGQAPRRRA